MKSNITHVAYVADFCIKKVVQTRTGNLGGNLDGCPGYICIPFLLQFANRISRDCLGIYLRKHFFQPLDYFLTGLGLR